MIASERTDSGHRRYPRTVLRLVAFIVFAQKIGLSLEEIRAELAKLPRNRAPERADWAKLSGSWTKRIEERIAELERMKTTSQRVYRVRLPFARPLPVGESRRSCRAPRCRPALLDPIAGPVKPNPDQSARRRALARFQATAGVRPSRERSKPLLCPR